MAHRHLVIAYVVTFVIQFAYLAWIGLKHRALLKLEREFPAYSPQKE